MGNLNEMCRQYVESTAKVLDEIYLAYSLDKILELATLLLERCREVVTSLSELIDEPRTPINHESASS